MSRRRLLAGAIALVACGEYLVAEAVTAAAWRPQPYSYTHNYISDLGIPCQAGGHLACSPLASVMNGGLAISAALCFGAVLLLAPLLLAPGRWLVTAFAAIHAAGTLGVAAVHSAPGTDAGTPRAHIVAAYLAVLGGDALLIAAGWTAHRSGAPGRYSNVGIGLGLVGLAGAVALVTTSEAAPGLFERAAVDVITFGELFGGIALLAALVRSGYAPILAERP